MKISAIYAIAIAFLVTLASSVVSSIKYMNVYDLSFSTSSRVICHYEEDEEERTKQQTN